MKTLREKRQEQRRRALIQQRDTRIQRLIDGGFIRDAQEIPSDAIPAVVGQQKDGRFTYRPRYFYRDEEFTCKECGKKEIWKAEDQQWYYEIVKGSIQRTAILCHDCRVKKRRANQRVDPTSVSAPRSPGGLSED